MSALTIGGITLSPAFNSTKTEYTATTTELESTITAETDDPSAVIDIKFGDATIENGSAIEWASGENIVTITVTDGESVTTYTVTVTVPAVATTLSALTVGSLTLVPEFASETSTYTATTTNSTNTITATATDERASISVKVNDVEIDNGTAATWEAGENTVKIDVGDPIFGSSSRSYYVTVTKTG